MILVEPGGSHICEASAGRDHKDCVALKKEADGEGGLSRGANTTFCGALHVSTNGLVYEVSEEGVLEEDMLRRGGEIGAVSEESVLEEEILWRGGRELTSDVRVL